MKTKYIIILLSLFSVTISSAQTVEQVKGQIDTVIINPTQARSLTNAMLGIIMKNMVKANADYTLNSFNSVGSANLKGSIDTSITPSSSPSGSWWFLKSYPNTDSITFPHLSNIKVYKGETVIAIKNDTGYIKYALPFPQLVDALILAKDLINYTTFETVKQPLSGISRTRFNQDDLTLYNTNYGTSLTRIIDSSFQYSGVLTSIQYYSTRPGIVNWKSLSKNLDGTYNVIASMNHTAVVGLNTIDSATLAQNSMTVVAGGTLGFYGSASTGGGVGFLSGSMATKTITGNVGGSNLTFGATGTTTKWGLKATIYVPPTVAQLQQVLPYGTNVPPIYDNQITYSGGADTLSNLFNSGTIVNDQLVTSTGTISTSAGWKYISIPITDKQKSIFISKINVRPGTLPNSGYLRFANPANITLSYYGYTANKDTSYPIPAGASAVMIDIQDPSTTSTAYEKAIVSYRGQKAVKINGIDFAGTGSGTTGNPFNQELFTYSSPQFDGLRLLSLYLGWLPVGNGSEPDGVDVGDLWRDWDGVSTSSTIKLREQ